MAGAITWVFEADITDRLVDPSEITQIGGSARVLLEPSQHSVWSHLV